MSVIIIAEVGINADGDVSIAKKLIDVAKASGCDYIKFQKRDIDSVYSKEQLDSYRESKWGNTLRAQKEGLEFSLQDYKEIDRYCKEKEIGWYVSMWDCVSIGLMISNFPDMPFIKIPSAKVTDNEFLIACKETKIPLILSTGMCDIEMIKMAVSIVANNNLQYILGCTSSYPCPTEDINLNQIKYLKYCFGSPYIKIGWSDHSGSILFPSMAVGLGAEMIEVHITLSRSAIGTDHAASLEPEGLRKLVKYIRALEMGLGEPVKKVYPSEEPIMKKLRRT